MAETELNIRLTLDDQATAGINRLKQDVGQGANGVKDFGDKAKEAGVKTKGFGEQLKESSNQLRDIRRTAFLATAALAVVIKSVSDASKYSLDAKKTFDGFTVATTSLSVTLGQILQPALVAVTHVVNFLRDSVEAVLAGFIKVAGFLDGFFSNLSQGPVEAYKMAISEANFATDEFLKKIEETRTKVESGVTLDPIKIKKSSDSIKEGLSQIQQSAESIRTSLSGAVSGPLSQMISGAKTAGDAFKQMGSNLVEVIANFIAETLVAATIGKAIQTVATALSITQANILGAAWLPAATFASIATFGGAAAAGAAGVSSALGSAAAVAQATSAAMLVGGKRFHDGGVIRAHSGLAIDEVPIIAQTGEGILSRRGMANLGGTGELNRLNNGGGREGGISVNVYYPKMSNREEVDELAETLGLELQRQLRYAR